MLATQVLFGWYSITGMRSRQSFHLGSSTSFDLRWIHQNHLQIIITNQHIKTSIWTRKTLEHLIQLIYLSKVLFHLNILLHFIPIYFPYRHISQEKLVSAISRPIISWESNSNLMLLPSFFHRWSITSHQIVQCLLFSFFLLSKSKDKIIFNSILTFINFFGFLSELNKIKLFQALGQLYKTDSLVDVLKLNEIDKKSFY